MLFTGINIFAIFALIVIILPTQIIISMRFLVLLALPMPIQIVIEQFAPMSFAARSTW
jgi:hypothetical protein